MLFVPTDNGRLDLHDVDRRQVRVPNCTLKRETDAEPADEKARCGGGRTLDGGVDQQALRRAVARVHEEDAVADDLEPLARASEDELAAACLHAVDGLR